MKSRHLLLIAVLLLPSIASASASASDSVLSYGYNNHFEKQHQLSEKQFNVRMFIPGLFIGYLSGAADFKISPAITVGPIGKFFAYGKYTGFAVGAQMNYALNKQKDVFANGWLFNPFIEYYQSDFDGEKDEANDYLTTSSAVIGAYLVHQWMWDSGVNVRFGVGMSYSTTKLPLSIHIAGLNLGPNLELSMGYAF